MKNFQPFDYVTLPTEEKDCTPSPQEQKSPQRNLFNRFQWPLLHLVMLAAYTTFFLLALSLSASTFADEEMCTAQLSSWSPALPIVKYHTQRFDGRVFAANSVYKGSPSPALDEAWDRISHVMPFALPAEGVEKIGKKREDIVSVGEEQYLANLEVYHQLHCLNMLRKATRRDHYTSPYGEHESAVHLDHCIDILRTSLMCQADTAVITHSWVAGIDVPRADFSTLHQCRDFERILQWSHDQAGNWSQADVRRWRESALVVLDHDP